MKIQWQDLNTHLRKFLPLFYSLLSNNTISCIGKLGEVSFVEGVVHAHHLLDAQAFPAHEGEAATGEPLVVGQYPTGPVLGTYSISVP